MNEWITETGNAFHRRWALLTAGTQENYNTMTISWGGLGCLWNRQVATVYVRPSRYTYEFMEREDFFTVSFYPEEYRTSLATLGKLSGRDTDKVALTGLTPVSCGNSVTFEQAEITLLCRKLYAQDMDPRQIPADVMDRFYGGEETVHRLYIGEVLEVLEPKRRNE